MKSRRLTRSDWLVAGLEALAAEGIGGVCVERLAESLGVTKGSFYWHFQDRGELLACLLEFWEAERTDRVGSHIADITGSPQQRLLSLLEAVTREDINRYDAAVRAWAMYDERAATHADRVDKKRLDYVRDLFVEMGFSEEQADLRSRMSYYYLVGEASVFETPLPDQRRLEFVRLRHQLLTEC